MIGTAVTIVDTLKPPISSLSTMEAVQKQQQPQQQQDSVKSLDLQCDEEFDETLAERPSTSHNHLHQQQQQQQQQYRQQQHSSTDSNVSMTNGEAVIDSPLFNKMKREWRNYGCYTSCEEMDEVRRREKVSKRKSVTSAHGTKVFYRCNNWRRTRCNFRMYAIIFTSNKICLFASGEHDHTAKDPYYVTEVITPQVERDPETTHPTTAQQDILAQFVMNATSNLLPDAHPESREASTSQLLMSYLSPGYQLADEQRITGMLQLAMEIDHKFTFIQRSNEFCFEPNDPTLKGRSIVLLDGGTVVLVIERFNGTELSREIWQKAYWSQFLWAIRGKCMRVLYQNFKEPANL
ncbi:unnamed protein product [Cercopithifilaria johnstoni]|uniref:Uncharacterized protein n=1 Tax=Cercopithifilaria johnstoni TaxID=2874296 RepID=A0A8J2MDX2_9BILA|nr:unnamed protein product [Cercopithifilaria johnstoni]